MDITQKGIITLLKSAISQTALPLPENFDLEQAIPQIKRHSVATMAYDGAVRCGIPPKDPVMQQLFAYYCRILMKSEGQQRELSRIFRAFEEKQIDYMPLKGCNMKALYPKPEMRDMGDADILIRMDQYGAIQSILENLGFRSIRQTDHELVWQSDALYLELHKRVIPTYDADLYRYFGDGWDLAARSEAHCYFMSVENEWLYLFTHFVKHYRGGGIGCRHVLDLWVYLRCHPTLNEAWIREELQKLQLLTFYENIRRLLAVWFEDEEPNEITECMTAFIFACGNWGDVETRMLSNTIRNSRSSGRSDRMVFLRNIFFPRAKVMVYQYPILNKAPWLLPVCWVIRLIQKLFHKDAMRRGMIGMRKVTDDAVDQRRQMLNYVGLDFNF